MDHQYGGGTENMSTPAPHRALASVAENKFYGWCWFAFNLSDGAAVTIMGPHTNPDGPYPVKVPGVGGTYISPGPDFTPFAILGTLELTFWATSPLTGAEIPAGWRFRDVQILPRSDGKKPPHNNFEWNVTPWNPTPIGQFSSLSEYAEGGGDVVGSYDNGHFPFKGRGFCESVGFEPSTTYLPKLWNGIQVEYPARRMSNVSDRITTLKLDVPSLEKPKVTHLNGVTTPFHAPTPGIVSAVRNYLTTTVTWSVKGASKVYFDILPHESLPLTGHKIFFWHNTGSGPQNRDLPKNLIIEGQGTKEVVPIPIKW